jgi:hypothetical protein
MSDLFSAIQAHHELLLDALDNPSLDPANWEYPTFAEPAILRAIPDNAILVAEDETDGLRLKSLLMRLRGRGFSCTILSIDEYLAHRQLVGERVLRPIMSPSAMIGLIRRHRSTLAEVTHRNAQTIAGFRSTLMGKNGAVPEDGA